MTVKTAPERDGPRNIKNKLVHLIHDFVPSHSGFRDHSIIFGAIDYVKYAEACGAHGVMIKTPDDIASVMKSAFETASPVIVGVHVDYADNHKLFEMGRAMGQDLGQC
jgi:thiamine pyrophosphate-dependent acetolactate synthase large subunit-like protein